MNNFEKFNRIRSDADRNRLEISNETEVSGSNGFRFLHILWLYPDVLNIHGGRGDIMGLMHICNMLDIPVEIRRWDSMKEDIPYDWADMIYLNSGELKCAGDVAKAMGRQRAQLDAYVARGGYIIATASSGAILAKYTEKLDGSVVKGLGLLDMEWKERASVWGDDIWFKTEDGQEVIGNQIQVADVLLHAGQKPLGTIIYGRGNHGSFDEGARRGNVIFTSCLGPFVTKNPKYVAGLLADAAERSGIKVTKTLADDDIEIETESAKYIKNFMLDKMKNK
ncbi:MAG: hypothetical protein IJL99_03045 [Firmicutes bacterium]|nr:hypothetical protein [Bacillota bacterium]